MLQSDSIRQPSNRANVAYYGTSLNARDLELFTVALSRENALPGRRRSLALALASSASAGQRSKN